MKNNQKFSELNALMQNGINVHEKTGLSYYTGYAYKALYDWDQYFEAIVLLSMDWDREYIQNGVRIFMEAQHGNGFITRVTPVGDSNETYEHAKPFFAQIVMLLYSKTGDLNWVTQDIYNKLKKYILYWLINQDRNQNGLPEWESAPHTGMDNQHERAGWWKDGFCEGVDLSSFCYRECMAFAEIAKLFNNKEDNELFTNKAEQIKNKVLSLCWDEPDGFFYDMDARTGKKIRVKSAAAFSVLWAGIATKEQAQRMIKEHLLNPNEFWRAYPVPAYAATEPGYSETRLQNDLGCCWRANTWIPTNYYIAQGLKQYGYDDIACDLADKTFALVRKAGNREYYTSETGNGCGLNPFWGWSLLAYFMPDEFAVNRKND